MGYVTTKAVNGDIQVGDLVLSTPDDDYSGLIGRVLCINLVGSEAHKQETENETDDVHVNFLEFDYPRERVKEIEAVFTQLYGYKKPFEECPLDSVIMPPCSLIRITDIDKKQLGVSLNSELNAACYSYTVLSSLANSSAAIEKQNHDMSGFNIIRRINGASTKIELTEQDLLDAFSYQEHKNNIDSICIILGQMELEGSLKGRSAGQILVDDGLMKLIVEEYEATLAEFEREWREPAIAAITKHIRA